jgi:hypothetical protein
MPGFPRTGNALRFPCDKKGVPLSVEVTHDGVTIANRGSSAVAALISGSEITLEATESCGTSAAFQSKKDS